MIVQAEHNFVSLGQVAADLQRAAREIERSLVTLGLQPPLRLSGVLYLSEEQCEQVATYFRNQK